MVSPRYILVTLFYFTLFSGAAAQEMHFENITKELGLPSLECYSVTQDKKGYIWIATEAGMCRYNGSGLSILDGRNGLPEGAVYASAEAADSALWMGTSEGRILRYKNDIFYEPVFINRFFRSIYRHSDIPGKFFYSGDGLVYISTMFHTVSMDLRTGALREVGIKKDTVEGTYVFRQTANGLVPLANDHQFFFDNKIKVAILGDGTHNEIILPVHKMRHPYWQLYACRVGQTDFFSYESRLVRLNPDFSYSVHTFPGRIINLYADSRNGLWVGCIKGGVYYYPDTEHMETFRQSLPGYSVTGICEDKENSIWCSTLEKGVFYCRNKNILYYSSIPGLDKAVDMLKCENGRIFVSCIDKYLVELTPGGIREYDMEGYTWSAFTDIVKSSRGWMLSQRLVMVQTDEGFRNLKKSFNKNSVPGRFPTRLCHTGGERILGIQNNHVYVVTENGNYFYFVYNYRASLRNVFYAGNDSLLFGTRYGIFRSAYPDMWRLEKVPGTNASVTQIVRLRSGLICAATKSGLFVLVRNRAVRVDGILQIPADVFFDITQDRHGAVWLASATGLVKITENGGRYRTQLYSALNGLPSDNIDKVAADADNLYLSTSEGICTFPLTEELANNRPPPVYIHEVWVNDRPVDHKSGALVFPHDENSLRIDIDALTFKKGRAELLYELSGPNGRMTKKNEGNVIVFDNLPPGNYRLAVYALNNDGLKSTRPAVLEFGISNPFWLRAWFMVLCVLSFLAGVYVVFRRSVKAVKRREEEKNRIHRLVSESKLSALQAQMNPHFIFNAINSIQNYILKKKEQDAYDYLAKFGRLIRTVLNHSLQKNLALYQELDTIKLYVELEQLRFKNAFEFRVQVHETVNIYETYVPAMLIQPYVENAIWHGLMKLDNKRKGVLLLDICIEGDRLKVTVEDNGVGRARAAEGRRDDFHLPVAAVLTEQRLAIINNMQGYETTHISVVDLFDAEGNACGTRVEIWVPVNHF